MSGAMWLKADEWEIETTQADPRAVGGDQVSRAPK